MTGTGMVSWGARYAAHAADDPDRTAIIFAPRTGPERRMSWGELDRAANRVARLLLDRGANERAMVVIALPNGVEHFVVCTAAWRLGACVLPVDPAVPGTELDHLLGIVARESGRSSMVIGDAEGACDAVIRAADLRDLRGYADTPLPDRTPRPGRAYASGGSTGRPKISLDTTQWARVPGDPTGDRLPGMARALDLRPYQVQLVSGQLYHNMIFGWAHNGLFEAHVVVVMDHFDAAHALDLIERHRVNWMVAVPTMLRRMAQVPDVADRDFSSLHALCHAGAPCPPGLKRRWIELIGAERLIEFFGASEANGFTVIRGDEWLTHVGSVGRTLKTDLRILGEDGKPVPPGQVGEVVMRRDDGRAPASAYLGAPPPRSVPGGYWSVGDLGWTDDEGYLYLADRRVDLIISGGANVYPAEVEAALSEHPDVADVVVIGLPDDEWGKRVHAIVQPREQTAPPSPDSLAAHLKTRLASYKRPRSFEIVDQVPRDEYGKIRRGALVAERTPPSVPPASSLVEAHFGV